MGQLKQEITLMSGIGQLSTTLMGTGLFMIPAIAAGIAGELTLWAWMVLFVAICPIALTFSQLGKRYPNAGGTAYFVRQAFNSKMETAVAWLFISVIPVGIPAAITLAGGFAQQLLPTPLNTPLVAQATTILLLIWVSLAGTKSSGQLQTVIALSIFALVGVFLWQGKIQATDITMPALNSNSLVPITSALGVMFWCFVGIEAFAHMGEEFKNPQRDFPIAILIGCFVAGATYWACTIVVLKFGAYGTPQFDNASIPWLSSLLFGEQFSAVVSIIGFFACFASINLYIQSFSRMLWTQARLYRPDSRIAQVSRRGIPANATLLVGSVVSLSCFTQEITQLDMEFFLKLANGIFVLVYLLAMAAAVKLLEGVSKWLARLSLLLCCAVFLCLGWSMLYALAIFTLLLLYQPQKQTIKA
jgi:amino acid efflux transporter